MPNSEVGIIAKGFRVQGLEVRVYGVGFMDLGFRV